MKPANISWNDYVWTGLGRRLAKLGERFDCDSLIYNRWAMRDFHGNALHNAPFVVKALLGEFPSAVTFLDVGCGGGAFCAELQRQGKKAIGLERSSAGRALARKQGVDCKDFDLTRGSVGEVHAKVDAVYCFEVAEHLPEALGLRLVEFIAGFRVPVIFSAAQPGQGGIGHINEQKPEYWQDLFERRGLLLDCRATENLRSRLVSAGASSWFCNNPMIFLPDSGFKGS
jgi:SAM-dependent methyltransferase